MLKASVTGISTDRINLRSDLSNLVKQIADDVYKTAKEKTPVRTGNARSKWTEKTTSDNFEVKNQVPYIGRLEAGASRKAPQGIIGPTLTTIKGKYK